MIEPITGVLIFVIGFVVGAITALYILEPGRWYLRLVTWWPTGATRLGILKGLTWMICFFVLVVRGYRIGFC